jgi:hypothetical protein
MNGDSIPQMPRDAADADVAVDALAHAEQQQAEECRREEGEEHERLALSDEPPVDEFVHLVRRAGSARPREQGA